MNASVVYVNVPSVTVVMIAHALHYHAQVTVTTMVHVHARNVTVQLDGLEMIVCVAQMPHVLHVCMVHAVAPLHWVAHVNQRCVVNAFVLLDGEALTAIVHNQHALVIVSIMVLVNAANVNVILDIQQRITASASSASVQTTVLTMARVHVVHVHVILDGVTI